MGTTSKVQTSVLASRVDKADRDGNENRGKGGNWWESGKGGKGDGTRLGRSESEEYIVGRDANGSGRGNAVPLEIWESRDVTIDRGSVLDAGRSVTTVTSPKGTVKSKSGRGSGGNGLVDMGMRTGMYDGSGKEFETRTTVTAVGSGRKSESGSSRSLRL